MSARLKRFTEREWATLDRLLVAALLVLAQLNAVLYPDREGPLVAAVAIAAVVPLALLWRRAQPLVTLAIVSAAAALTSLLWTPAPEYTYLTATIILSSYSVAVHSERREAFVGLAVAVALVAGLCIAFTPTDIAFPVAIFGVVPWLVGRSLRNNTLLAQELAEKAEMLEAAREEEEGRAVGAERSRVARELHDVLAHNLSVMVIQASAAGRVCERNPDGAIEAADLIQRTGRETLGELRHLFGPVRKGEGEALSGTPGLDHVDGLVDRARAAGMPVDLQVEGRPPQLPGGVDATGYRLVQEALTNSLKHARGASARVSIRYEGWDLIIEVLDDGPGPEANGSAVDSGGHGLLGMRERVELYGGRLEAGGRRGGGFAVRARLPLGEGALA